MNYVYDMVVDTQFTQVSWQVVRACSASICIPREIHGSVTSWSAVQAHFFFKFSQAPHLGKSISNTSHKKHLLIVST